MIRGLRCALKTTFLPTALYRRVKSRRRDCSCSRAPALVAVSVQWKPLPWVRGRVNADEQSRTREEQHKGVLAEGLFLPVSAEVIIKCPAVHMWRVLCKSRVTKAKVL